jgi:hydrogenase nickel incorporation protein HypA/HybF
MHELSIAASIVEIACEEAGRQHGARVEAVHLKVGPLSGVVTDSLLFAWDLACADTPIAGSRLAIEQVPIVIHCATCAADRTLPEPLDMRCPVCGSTDTSLVHGTELQLTALEIED